jgi:hypothetical protein
MPKARTETPAIETAPAKEKMFPIRLTKGFTDFDGNPHERNTMIWAIRDHALYITEKGIGIIDAAELLKE